MSKFAEVEKTVRDYMMLADAGVVRLICATMVSNAMPTPPSWIFIVGNSSGGKSMILNALKTVTGIYEIDDMTASTFASGMKGGGETSMLHQIPTNGTVLIKDYTTMLSKDQESRGQILGQMRKIFDGDYRKKFGNGQEVNWTGKMGMLAGVTTKIYTQEASGDNAALGERYLYYMMDMPDRKAVGMMSTEVIKDSEANKVMRVAFSDYLNPIIADIDKQLKDGTFIVPKLTKDIRHEIVNLSEMTTRARSAVERNKYSRDKDVEMVHALEMTPRFAKALVCVAYGLLLCHRYDGETEELTEQDKAILFKIALDSIPLARKQLLEAMTTNMGATEAGIRQQTGWGAPTIKLYLGDLEALGLVSVEKSYGSGWTYSLKEEYRELMAKYRHLDMGTKVLDTAEGQIEVEPVPVEQLSGEEQALFGDMI